MTVVVSASLTGPFGSRIAEYRDGRVTGEDRSALLVEPEAMRAVLAGAWNGAAPSVEGVDAGDALLVFEAEHSSVRVVLDVARRAPVSLEIEGGGGHVVVDYGGETDPWPSRVDASEETTHRRVTLKLLALEKADGEAAAR